MKKCILCFVLLGSIFLALTGCGSAPAAEDAPFSGGAGTPEDPYRISTDADLWELAERTNRGDAREAFAGACYILTGDIDLGSKNWTPIAMEGTAFTGTLDGDGHTVRGLKIHATAKSGQTDFGLVSRNQGTIRNLTISDSSIQIKGSGGNAAAFAGSAFNGTFENCRTTASVEISSSYCAAGICANLNKGSALSGCANSASITSTGDVGQAAGIGCYVSCPIRDCTNDGTVSSQGDAAGIAVSASGGLQDCVNTGVITARSYCAGVVCRFSDGALNHSMNDADISLLRCTNSGSVSSREDPAGGIAVSCRTGLVRDCVNTGAVSSPMEAGGILAYFQQDVFGEACPEFRVIGCTNSGSVTALESYAAGGICGEVYGNTTAVFFENCENTGDIHATGKPNTVGSGSEAGGIVGCANVTSLTLSDCRNSGSIRGFGYAGGILGRAYPDNHAEAAQTELSLLRCSNDAPVYVTEPGGLLRDIYAGGIAGHCQVISLDEDLLLAFDRIREEGCSNSGRVGGDQIDARLHYSEIFGNQEDF